MPVLLLLLFSISLSIGLSVIAVVVRRGRQKVERASPEPELPGEAGEGSGERASIYHRPGCWLAVRSRNLCAVQAALGLHNPKPCTWFEGLLGDAQLFIAPPVKGWILVIGEALPDPLEDVDACFRFVLELSRKLGQVQLFSASRVVCHHAWVKAERGRVQRAYAWAGRTVWQQGTPTPAEKELDLKCFDYSEAAERSSFNQADPAAVNVEKVPLLAARWSLDPGRVDERHLEYEHGVAGTPGGWY
jgi:hypothetical protein